MRKIIVVFMMFMLVFTASFTESSEMIVSVNGRIVQFTSDTGLPFRDDKGILMVPANLVMEEMNANFSGSNLSDHFIINKNQKFINIVLNESFIYVEDNQVYIESTPKIINNKVYIPIKVIAEYLGYETYNDEVNNKFEIYNKGNREGIMEEDVDIPLNQFKVSYFDTRSPNEIVKTEYKSEIGVNTAENIFGIPPNYFGARWVGMFEFLEPTEKIIRIDKSWSSVNLKIDGQPVAQGDYLFTRGRHKIECDFSNNWHTVDVLVNIIDPVKEKTGQDLTNDLGAIINKNTKTYYVGIYESNTDDHSVLIELNKTDGNEEVILFLSSYGAVNWKIKNDNKVKLKSVVYNSYKDGSTVEVLDSSTVKCYSYPELINGNDIYPNYTKAGHDYHVTDNEFPSINEQIIELTGSRLDGWTSQYSSEKLLVPSVILDQMAYDKIEATYDEMNTVVNRAPQRPDNLFGQESLTNSWGDILNLKAYIPTGVFKAYHFNTMEAKTVIASDIIDEPKLSYAWSDFKGIESEDYGSYYVGRFEFDEVVTKKFIFFNGWSFIRMTIDGEVVYKSWEADDLSLEHFFSKGDHIIEVEYINDWHTTDFMVSMTDDIPIKTREDINDFIKAYTDSDTKFYILNDHESSELDFKTVLDFKDAKGKVFLILNSSNPIHWVIEDVDNVDLQGILYASYWNGSKIINNSGRDIPVIYGDYIDLNLDYPDSDTSIVPFDSSQYIQIEQKVLSQFDISSIHGFRLNGNNPKIYHYLFGNTMNE